MTGRQADLPTVDLQVACDAPGLPNAAGIADWLALSVAMSGTPLAPASEVSIRIVDEPESQALNQRYRDREAPTNVLSFPAELERLPGLPPEAGALLGDLVICAPVVAREAKAQGKKAADHWAHMLVHGFLHLLGFDHMSDDEARRMEDLEALILAAKSVPNPYKQQDAS